MNKDVIAISYGDYVLGSGGTDKSFFHNRRYSIMLFRIAFVGNIELWI